MQHDFVFSGNLAYIFNSKYLTWKQMREMLLQFDEKQYARANDSELPGFADDDVSNDQYSMYCAS